MAGLLAEVEAALVAPKADRRRLHAALDALSDIDGIDGPGVHRVERALTDRLEATLTGLWERGWEPAEVVHIARRRSALRPARLAAAVVVATLAGARDRGVVPARWHEQLDALERSGSAQLSDPTETGSAPAVLRWRLAERVQLDDAVEDAVRLSLAWRHLPDLEPLDEPPSRWRSSAPRPAAGDAPPPGAPPAAPATAVAPKLLDTIRALLAKAESTSFPAEADAFTAKAQDLMRRHAVDAALLDGRRPRHGDVAVRRVAVEEPYSDEKVELLAAVADLNDVQVAWDHELGLATVIGLQAELDGVELLFLSLLVQATRALNDPANAEPDRRAPAFRRAFLAAYSDRIARRLRQAQRHAERDAGGGEHAGALLPVLAARRDAVRAVADELFGAAPTIRTRMVDAAGWEAGTLAADAAPLGSQPELSPDGRRR